MDNINIDMPKLQRDSLTLAINSYFPDIKLLFMGVILFSLLTTAKPSIGTTLFLTYHTSCRLILVYSDFTKYSSFIKKIAKINIRALTEIRKSYKALQSNIILNEHALQLRFGETKNTDPRYKAILIKKCSDIENFLKKPPSTHSKGIALAGVIVNRGIIIGYAGYATLNTILTLRYFLSYLDKSSYLFDTTMCIAVLGTIPLIQNISKKHLTNISSKLLMPFYKENLEIDKKNSEAIISPEMATFLHDFTENVHRINSPQDDEGYSSESTKRSSH